MKDKDSGGVRIRLGWMIAALVFVALVFGAESMWVGDWLTRQPPAAEVVQTQRAIAAFTLMRADDLTLAPAVGTAPAQAFTDPAQAAGRVALTDLPAQTALTAANSLAVPDGWQILALPISSTLAVQPGETLTLIGISAAKVEGDILSGQALGLGQQDDLTILALPSGEARRAAAYLIGDRSLALLRPTGIP